MFIRNYTKRPLYSFVGMGVSSIHKIIFNSKQNIVGVYKDKRTHRYEARKDLYEQLYEHERHQSSLFVHLFVHIKKNIFRHTPESP